MKKYTAFLFVFGLIFSSVFALDVQAQSNTSYQIGCIAPFKYSPITGQLCVYNTTPHQHASVNVVSPNGGESYAGGQQVLVKWNSQNSPYGTVLIGLWSSALNQTMELTITNNDGEEWVTIPTTGGQGNPPLASGNYYKIYAALGGNPSLSDYSNKTFTINMPVIPPRAQASCIIYLTNNTTTCNSTLITFTVPQKNKQAVVKVNLNPANGYSKAKFDVKYSDNSAPKGWTVNIGDSRTNDGWAGDLSTQENDAEMQVYNGVTVYGNDTTHSSAAIDKKRLLSNTSVSSFKGKYLSFTVGNNYLNWNMDNTDHSIHSPYLYALSGQADKQGPVNYDIYAAFNRVISGTHRTGTGAEMVTINLE